MTNKKAVKLSEEQKTEIKGIVQGAYDKIEIIPQTTKSAQVYEEIVNALKSGKYYVMHEGYSRNSMYVLLKKLKETSEINAMFGITQSVVDGVTVKQFALFIQKEKA